jgi:hypothetical protein
MVMSSKAENYAVFRTKPWCDEVYNVGRYIDELIKATPGCSEVACIDG